jgi:subtilisin family serine protease
MANENYSREQLHRDMMHAVLTEPLLSDVRERPDETFAIIISLNDRYEGGLPQAKRDVMAMIEPRTTNFNLAHPNYVFAKLTGRQIQELSEIYRSYVKGKTRWHSPVYRVWKDQTLRACLTKSVATVKADAAQRSFHADGQGITWAVVDSGIDKNHIHFKGVINEALSADFVGQNTQFQDDFGHGTHVAGIISGSYKPAKKARVVAVESLIQGSELAEEVKDTEVRLEELEAISGVAPKTKLVSLKVLGEAGEGTVSAALLAIQYIQEKNQFGRHLVIHGVNMSIGYDFNARWFGCGQSPLCVEVDRLVKSGVVVVVAAGNTGFSTIAKSTSGGNELGYRAVSINDPGNADLAITVGSTHRDMPHTYGVSYFSSRGPTGDGRLKPDLVAPGEHIVSCAAGTFLDAHKKRLGGKAKILYLDQSGTSQAAPHVSGAIAAFLSVRREFIGQPEKVKQFFLDAAIDLKRERSFQGHGLLDLMKVLQAV